MIKQILIIAVILGISMSFMVPRIGKLTYGVPPTYRIDLNVAPEHRWDEIVPEFVPFFDKFLFYLGFYKLSDEYLVKVGEFGENSPHYSQYVDEIKGIANTYADLTGSTESFLWQKTFLLNFFFELPKDLPSNTDDETMSMCSAIIAKMKDGKIIHGRNFDLFPMWLLSRGSINVKVYKGDKYVANFNTIAGAVIVWQGSNANGFSLTLNARGHTEGNVIQNIVEKGYITAPYLLRGIIQDDTMDYESAKEILKTTEIAKSMYYVLGGIDQGTLIEKGVHDYNHILEIGPDTEEWFIIQTNYDLWQDPGIDDRKTPAAKRLEKIGQDNINIDVLFEDVMVKYPTLNMGTTQTTSYVPYETYSNYTCWYGTVDKYWDKEIYLEETLIKEDPYFKSELEKEFFNFSQEYVDELLEDFMFYYEQIRIESY